MICVECNPEKALVSTLGFEQKEILHTHGKGNACNLLLKKNKYIALLDQDPLSAQPSYLRGLTLGEEKYDLRFLEDSARGNRIVLLCPRLEEWIAQTAKAEKIVLQKYGLPPDARSLHEVLRLIRKN